MTKNNIRKNAVPDNYILLASKGMDEAYGIVREAGSSFPSFFRGKRQCFPFELRYVQPFERDFRELRRLQGTAAEAAGFRDEFVGYIVIDLSAYIQHEEDVYLDISLKFLYDMNEWWKYIFLVDNSKQKAARDLISKILYIFEDIPCKVLEGSKEFSGNGRFLSDILAKCRVACTESARALLLGFLEREEFSRPIISRMILEISDSLEEGREIGVDAIGRYLQSAAPGIKYMLSQKAYEACVDAYNSFKGKEEQNEQEI